MDERKFTGIFIPAWVIDLGLPIQAEKLYSIILSLQGTDGCFASSEYLAEKLGIHPSNARRWIQYLKDNGLVKMGVFDGRKRWLIALMDNPELLKNTIPRENARADRAKTREQTARKRAVYNKEDSIVDKDPNGVVKSVDSLAKDIFYTHYHHWVKEDFPYWDGKEAGGLSGILKRIRSMTEKYRERKITDDELLEAFDIFLTKVGMVADEFILRNFTPSYLISAFNKLITSIRQTDNGRFKQQIANHRAELRADERARQWGYLFKSAGGSGSTG